jgi:hypothetical protein
LAEKLRAQLVLLSIHLRDESEQQEPAARLEQHVGLAHASRLSGEPVNSTGDALGKMPTTRP